ncbi:MAG TPA: hypothetical protein PLU80_16170, partial [Acidobacteriota bacterium]|nr:hypothetical protein [Acidobacteriota bacterium]
SGYSPSSSGRERSRLNSLSTTGRFYKIELEMSRRLPVRLESQHIYNRSIAYGSPQYHFVNYSKILGYFNGSRVSCLDDEM